MSSLGARQHLQEWIATERKVYADLKYAEGSPQRDALIDAMQANPSLEYSEWWVFIANYLSRVRLFPLNTHQGRQAMGKLIVTLMACLETAIEVHGLMPQPGHPSGEIRKDT